MTAFTLSRSFSVSDRSISPSNDLNSRSTAVQIMNMAIMIAITGSNHVKPVSMTMPIPLTSATEVQKSVNKCCPSASRIIKLLDFPSRTNHHPIPPLIAAAPRQKTRPKSNRASSRGFIKRSMAIQMMPTPATRTRAPSKPLEKYAILS